MVLDKWKNDKNANVVLGFWLYYNRPSLPKSTNPNLKPVGDGFGFVDENLTAKFEKDFEAPDKNEIDFFAEKL